VGRFVGRDPDPGSLPDPRSRHPFLYAHADPINRTDPTGRFTLIELQIAQVTAEEIRSTIGKNMITKVFFPAGKIALCQLKPAFQLRQAGLLMIAADLPGGDHMVDAARSLILEGCRAITETAKDFAKSLEIKGLKFEVGGLLTKTIKNVTGADPGDLLDPNLTNDERLKKLVEFKVKLEQWLQSYAEALDALRSDDDCKRWDGVTFFGEKALDVLPGF
jgi:hypothetical protein